MRKYTKEDLYKMDAVEVYKMVLRGDIIKAFPSGFWQQEQSLEKAAQCTRYLIEIILNYDEEKIKEKNSQAMFSKNKLCGMMAVCFNYSPYEVINNAYPNKYKEWEFKNVPKNYWKNKENGIKATKWLIEERLKMDEEELKEKLSQKIFIDNNLASMLQTCFKGSPYEAINNVYPNKYKEWEFNHVPLGYWSNKENGIKAIKWLIEEKLDIKEDEILNILSIKLFIENGLAGMLQYCFNNNIYEAVNSVYPNKYKEWEFKNVPKNYWKNKENGIKATKWLIEDKLNLNDEELKDQLSIKLFEDNGMRSMLQYCFNDSPYQAINSIYPNKFKEWEFKNVPIRFWQNEENGIKAVKWLIEEKLKLSNEEIKEKISVKLFEDNGLIGMLARCFNNSPYEAINKTYPNRYREWELTSVSQKYWQDKKNAIESIKWLVEEKLQLNDEDLKNKLSFNLFKENGLSGVLRICFNNSPYEAINTAYPNKYKKEDFKTYSK